MLMCKDAVGRSTWKLGVPPRLWQGSLQTAHLRTFPSNEEDEASPNGMDLRCLFREKTPTCDEIICKWYFGLAGKDLHGSLSPSFGFTFLRLCWSAWYSSNYWASWKSLSKILGDHAATMQLVALRQCYPEATRHNATGFMSISQEKKAQRGHYWCTAAPVDTKTSSKY